MPPNAPAEVNRDGTRVEPPPMLEDWELDLQRQGGGGGLFGGGKGADAPAQLDELRGLKRGGG